MQTVKLTATYFPERSPRTSATGGHLDRVQLEDDHISSTQRVGSGLKRDEKIPIFHASFLDRYKTQHPPLGTFEHSYKTAVSDDLDNLKEIQGTVNSLNAMRFMHL